MKDLEKQKERVWELYEYLKELESCIDERKAALANCERDRKEIIDILSGKLPLMPVESKA